MQTTEEIEQINRKRYEEDYTFSQVSLNRTLNGTDYFQKMAQIRLEFIRKYGHNKKVLDIGCGTGDYLFESKNVISECVGIDFTKKRLTKLYLRRMK